MNEYYYKILSKMEGKCKLCGSIVTILIFYDNEYEIECPNCGYIDAEAVIGLVKGDGN